MDIFNLIKNRGTVRKYKDKSVPKKIINKIIEAGSWASSIHGFQPWFFVVITQRGIIRKIAEILYIKSKKIGTGPNILMSSTANTISNAEVLIAVYNTRVFENFAKKFRNEYFEIACLSEIESISAAIQNIIISAEHYGIGSCWTVIPLFCEKEINKLINAPSKLVAILTLGYPQEKANRSKRKPKLETLKYIS